MSALQLSLPIAGLESAQLSLPLPLSLGALDRLEQAMGHALIELRGELRGRDAADAAVEYASWQQHLRPAWC